MQSCELGRYLVVGSINIDWTGGVCDASGADSSVEIRELTVTPGGHAGNCAASICKLGGNARILGCVGADQAGDTAMRHLAAAGVDVRYVERTTDEATGFAFIPVKSDGARILYAAIGANRCLTARELNAALEGVETVIVFDPPSHALDQIIGALSRFRGIFAPGRLLTRTPPNILRRALTAARYLIFNEIEAKQLSGAICAERAAMQLAREWGSTAIVTVGALGSWMARSSGEVVFTRKYQLKAVDTTGAADAFVAGFSWGLTSGLTDESAMNMACAAGELATRKFGAQASLPTVSEVEKLVSKSRCHSAPPVGVCGSTGNQT